LKLLLLYFNPIVFELRTIGREALCDLIINFLSWTISISSVDFGGISGDTL